MKATASYPGSIGEMIQGNFRGKDVLISCPVNFFTRVTLFESNCPVFKYNYPKSMQFMNNILKRWNYDVYEKNMDMLITSQIPKGKGFASSTADLCATYYALLKLFNKTFNERELIDFCIEVEPTDSIIFHTMTIFDYKKGAFKESIGEYFKFYLLVFEGIKTIDTVEFNNRVDKSLNAVDDLIKIFKNGLRKRALKDMALASTESILRNESRLKYNILSQIMSIKDFTGGVGIIGAHTGDCLAIIYENSQTVDKAIKSIEGILNYKIYKLETIDKEELVQAISSDCLG
ncbi:kinase [Clostridium sp. BJN0013]|uniref:GHMP family kinase ATP-binding protein n=1 Tax=Clostridium sp. BJN0013 TaxID=3236840 RepID=UPI0034C6AB93